MLLSRTNAFVENMLTLVNLLRRAGLSVSTNQVSDFFHALTLVNIGERGQVYHAARCLLVNHYEHLRLFETLFNVFWQVEDKTPSSPGQKAPRAPRHDNDHQP